MKRDMDLCRAVLFAIEEEYVDTGLCNLEIPEYTTEQVAYHCQLLHDAGLISSYNVKYADNEIYFLMLIDLTQHTTRCSNRSDKSQEYLITRHSAVETEAELIQV